VPVRPFEAFPLTLGLGECRSDRAMGGLKIVGVLQSASGRRLVISEPPECQFGYQLKLKLHLVDLLWIFCTAYPQIFEFTTNPQRLDMSKCCRFVVNSTINPQQIETVQLPFDFSTRSRSAVQ
jgi:hypothetical protein